MTDLIIVEVGDTWINSGKTGANYSDTSGVQLKSGSKIGLLLPELPALAGATVLDAYLVGRGAQSVSAQSVTVKAVTEPWAPGTVKYANRPATDSGSAVVTAVSAAAADVPVTIAAGLDSILQAVADGTDWYGLEVTTSTTTMQKFRSSDSGHPAWELHVVVSDVPAVPTNLRPDGGGAVGSATPILAWDFVDFGGSTTQGSSWVQVSSPGGGAADFVTPDYDSGWQSNVDSQWALAGRYTLPGADVQYWRVNVKDADGNESGWSDPAEFVVAAKPTLVIDSPTGAFGDPTPTIAAHLSTGDPAHWELLATGPDRSDVRLRPGLQTGDIEFTLPLKNRDGRRILKDDETSWARLRAWLSGDWAVAVGEEPYVDAWIPLAFDDDLGVTAPTNLLVAQIEKDDPRHEWRWDHNEVADAYVLTVDGRVVARLDPTDDDNGLELDGGTWRWTDNGEIPPYRPHTLGVRALDGGARSAPAFFEAASHEVTGVWLLPDAADPIVLAGTAIESFAQSDRVATYTPLVGPEIDVVYDYEGLKGDFEGTVDAYSNDDVWAALAQIETLRTSPVRTAQMVWGSKSIRVRIRNPHSVPSPDFLPSNLQHLVRFGFVEVG